MPTVKEQADERYRALEARKMRLEMDQEDKARSMKKTENRIKRLWAADKKLEARQAVHDLRRDRVEYTRIGRLKANVAAVSSKINELRAGTATEEALEFYVTSMYERLETTHPERFQHVLREVDRVQSMQSMTTDMLDEFFADEEQADRERDDVDDVTADDAVTAVLIELGCLRDLSNAPSIIEVGAPPSSPGGNGNGAAPLVPADAL